ncbi:GreA/GreB family elongation factor [Neobacillus kokaensis]|uniref:Transcription elongation factor GreA/GreB C-terminal domain-containing protein n=1 Tax=Neobacillus kokaensis TaxID=2759023 RepID=A0ABQ3NAM9_9BACI|nr:GreA/GreB family elongation factor [Neobacillus kokaensis]GHI00931.1 hypothetical protein AM1BK_44730 [Neobacillus kokaensis]
MNHSKEFFTEQLAYIEENIKDLTNLYISSTPIQERLKHFFNRYILEVEGLLKQNRNHAVISFYPMVYIGTKVTVFYDDEEDTEDYCICFPDESDPDKGFISFLSPVGRQLLLKGLGDKMSLKIPTGELQVTVKEISYVGDLFGLERRKKEA